MGSDLLHGHPQGLVLGSGKAEFRVWSIGGKKVNKHRRPDMDGPASATEVHLCRSSSVALHSYYQKEVAHSCVSSTEYRSGWIHACWRARTW